LNNMKNSSLAMVIGVAELTWQSQQGESLTFRGFEFTTAATVIYLLLSLTISAVVNMINVRLHMEEHVGRKSLGYRLADLFFWPFEKLWSILAFSLSLCIRRGRTPQSLRLSRGRYLWKRTKELSWWTFVLAAKAVFVALLVLLAFKIVQGLTTFNWSVIWDNLPTLLFWRFPSGDPNELFWGLGGLSFSILMALIAISISFFIGLFVGLGRRSKNKILSIPCIVYIEVIRGNPLIIVIFWVYFFLPIFVGAYLNVFWSATIALTVFTGAYIAEIVRGGIANIPKGQFEAAYGTGLSYYQTMRCIILPQALKQMIPAIVGQFIAIFKDTSLAFVIGVMELTFVAQGLNNRLMIYPFEIYTTIAVLYFLICYAMSRFAGRLEHRLTPETARMRM
jgi:polar amino acid transport system permease protein